MRVLHIITLSELGGAQRYVAELATRQRRSGFLVDIASGRAGWLTEQPQFDQRHEMPALRREIDLTSDVAAFAALRRVIGSGRYEVVHTHSSKAGVLGRLAAATRRVPIVAHTSHGSALAEKLSRGRRVAYWAAEQAGAAVTDRLFAVSATEAQLIARTLWVRPGALRVMTIVPDYIRSIETRWQPDQGSRWNLVAVGNLYANKAYDVLLRAVALLRGTHPALCLRILGDGPERPRLERLAAELSLTGACTFAGRSDDTIGEIARSGVFVLSSIKEGLPLVLLEAMATGTPVVATDVGAVAEALGAEIQLARAGDPVDLARRIDAVVSSDERARAVAASARAAYERLVATDSVTAVRSMYM